MKKTTSLLLLIALMGCAGSHVQSPKKTLSINYEIDVTHPQDDLFHVTVTVENLNADHAIYHFAATAPGTYDVMNFGRFVRTFTVTDAQGNEIPTQQISINQWRITQPEAARKICYTMDDTFDAVTDSLPIAPMSGSGIENDVVILNTFAVLGYFEGLQTHPVRVKVTHQNDWLLGTALRKDSTGYYLADTYDRLADSPMLLGKLTVDSTQVNNMDVKVYLYCPEEKYTASQIMEVADDVLQSAGKFIGYDPVPNYEFLFCLVNKDQIQKNGFRGFGALEHSYSSLYVNPVPRRNVNELAGIMSHEFFHILTPLNLHSEVIHTYNFAEPTSDAHIWLYEGVTEWASQIMQLRGGLVDTERYMHRVTVKMNLAERLSRQNPDYSLSNMSLEAFTPKGNDAFLNFYQLGALTAGVLDIRLLELSGGQRGLREVFLELLDEYGKNKPFSKDGFFQELVDRTYPEIEPFIDDYIKGTKPLPMAETYEKLGFKYIPERLSESTRPDLDATLGGRDKGVFVLENVRKRAQAYGLKEGDVLVSVFGETVTPQNVRELGQRLFSLKIGEPFDLVVKRDGQEIALNAQMFPLMAYHCFEEMESLTPEQKALREAWMKNL